MTTANPLDQVMQGRSLKVDIALIEDQLRELWKGSVEPEAGGEDASPVTRTSVMNLVVFTHEPAQEQSIGQTLGDLVADNPCRAIVVMSEPSAAESKIQAWISAHCHKPTPTSKAVCCEQISLHASGLAVRELAPTTIPFLVSDLPVFLWWKDNRLFESEFLKSFVGVCDRLILDSKRFASPQTEFPRLQNLIQKSWNHLAISDVAWHRLMQWRELTAQFFDTAVFRAHLPHIEKVTVEFNERAEDGSSIPPQAYLLAGWFASRLKWNLVGIGAAGEGNQFKLRSQDGRPTTILIRPTQARAELSGHLVSFEMATAEEWATTFRIGKGENVNCAETEIAFANMPPFRRMVPLRIYNEVELIARQLEIFGHDPIYEESIAMAARLVGSLTSSS